MCCVIHSDKVCYFQQHSSGKAFIVSGVCIQIIKVIQCQGEAEFNFRLTSPRAQDSSIYSCCKV